MGARDYDYLIENNHVLDNEITSIYPVSSYMMLLFVLFLLSFKSPMIKYLFDFKKHLGYGITSNRFMDTINDIHKKYPLPYTRSEFPFYSDNNVKNITYNFASRPFNYLKMPDRFILSPYYFGFKSEPVINKYRYLYFKDTELIKRPGAVNKYKFGCMAEGLDIPFKTEVLLYLPRFYYNYYSEKINRNEKSTKIDYQKMMLNTNVHVPDVIENIKTFFVNIGVNYEIPRVNLLLFNQTQKGLISDVRELHEFFLKSILIRRHPSTTLNTYFNRTEGLYLMAKGASMFKERLMMEKMRYGFTDYIKFHTKQITLDYEGKKRSFAYKKIVDFNNPPFLLTDKFMKLIDGLYKKQGELHHLLKYAQVYIRLFNQFGTAGVNFILANFLSKYTFFKYHKYLEKGKRPGMFYNFENTKNMKKIIWYFFRSGLIDEKRKKLLLAKYCI